MTRTEAKDFLISLGIEEPSKTQIDDYLNNFNGEVRKYNDRLEQGKKDAELVDELRAKLEALENQNLTDIERANKDKETAINDLNALKTQMRNLELKNSLSAKGIIGDDADNLIASLNEGTLDVELLGTIIANRETEAANKKEQDILKGSINPGGGKGKTDDDNVSSAEKFADSVISSMTDTKASQDIISSYY